MYDLVFRYEDGSFAKIKSYMATMCWIGMRTAEEKYFGPTAARSKLAWHGGAGPGEGKQPLRFCSTAVENPFPATTVTAMDLYSCKSQSAACILAFTPGRAGLMR